jgi:ribosomal protein L40E
VLDLAPNGYHESMSSVPPRVCSACGAPSAWDARFCQQCGRQLRDEESAPRYYGVLSPGPAFVLGVLLLLAAAVALIAGSVIVAIVLLALAVAAFVFFYEAARRNPDDAVARRVFASGHHVRGWVTFARASSSAWLRALRAVVRLRGESRSLRREREPTLRSLGDAAYREDEMLVTALRERIRGIDNELAKREEARAEAVAAARRHVDEELEHARTTQRFSVDEIESGGDSDR